MRIPLVCLLLKRWIQVWNKKPLISGIFAQPTRRTNNKCARVVVHSTKCANRGAYHQQQGWPTYLWRFVFVQCFCKQKNTLEIVERLLAHRDASTIKRAFRSGFEWCFCLERHCFIQLKFGVSVCLLATAKWSLWGSDLCSLARKAFTGNNGRCSN